MENSPQILGAILAKLTAGDLQSTGELWRLFEKLPEHFGGRAESVKTPRQDEDFITEGA